MEIFTNRLIAFFDILGFSERLRSMDLTTLHSLYSELIDQVSKSVFNQEVLNQPGVATKSNFSKAQFLFDSIVLVSKDISGENYNSNVNDFIFACSSLMEQSFERALPLRGVIGLGDYLDDRERNIFLAREFADMVHLEKQQEWSGCIFTPSAIQHILPVFFLQPELKTHYQHKAMILTDYDVPFKALFASSDKFWCLNWVYFLNPSGRRNGLDFLVGDKKANTSTFIDYILGLPDADRSVPETYLPVTHVLAQGTIGGVRIKFVNAEGEPAEPPKGVNVNMSLKVGDTEYRFQGPPDKYFGT